MAQVLEVLNMSEIYSDAEQRHYEDAETGIILVFDRPGCDRYTSDIQVTIVGVPE